MPRCPGCGASVSQFAAGCAICGYDLELSPRPRQRLRAPQVRLRLPLRHDQDIVLLVVIALLALGVVMLVSPHVRYGMWRMMFTR